MARRQVPLESWEAVVPGVVFPLVALWLGGSSWGLRGTAAAANLAPVVVLAMVTWLWGSRAPAVQGAATVAYGLVILGWVAATWELSGLAILGAHAGSWTPLAAAGVGIVVFALVRLVLRFSGGPVTVEEV